MNKNIVNPANIQERIFVVRGRKIMIDNDLGELYGVPTKYSTGQQKQGKVPGLVHVPAYPPGEN